MPSSDAVGRNVRKLRRQLSPTEIEASSSAFLGNYHRLSGSALSVVLRMLNATAFGRRRSGAGRVKAELVWRFVADVVARAEFVRENQRESFLDYFLLRQKSCIEIVRKRLRRHNIFIFTELCTLSLHTV